jgi:parallel beta-helix repeat protein
MRASCTLVLLLSAAMLPCAAAGSRECTVTALPGDDLQQAIEQAPRDGRRASVCLGAGEFRLAQFLSITRDAVTLRGAGSATVLRLEDGSESPVIVVGDAAHEIPSHVTARAEIEDLRIVGQGSAGSELHPRHRYLTNSAVVVRRGEQVTLRGLDVTACRSACILTEHGSHDVSIEGNRVGGAAWDGIALNRTSKARLIGNTIHGNRAGGITTEHLERSVVEDNVVTGNGTHGLYLSDSYRNVVSTNRFADNVLAGVFLTCAIRYHKPLVQCWDDSMSRENVFDRNEFVGNLVGYKVAAGCSGAGVNRSHGDLFAHNPTELPDWTSHGRCLRYERADGVSPARLGAPVTVAAGPPHR